MGNPLLAVSTEGDGEANRQDATQSQKSFHISDVHGGRGGVHVVCLDRKTFRRQGHRSLKNTGARAQAGLGRSLCRTNQITGYRHIFLLLCPRC